MQKLYIHIGTHKTATTWLQHFLAKNSDLLNDKGFYYPHTGRVTQAQHRLGQAIFQRPEPQATLEGLPLWEKFKRELALTRYENIVISSEEFEWVQLPRLIREFLPDVSIQTVVYLRRQDDYIESLYGQQIRDFEPRLKKTIGAYLSSNKLRFLDYASLIKAWSEASDHVHVRVFDKKFLKGGDIGEDFLNVLGIPSADGFEAPTGPVIDHKASLSLEALEFIRQCNHLPMNAATHNQLVGRVIQLDKVLAQAKDKKRQRLIDFETRKNIMDSYAADNAEIARSFPIANDLVALFSPIADDAQTFTQSDSFDRFDVLLKANNLVRIK